MRTSYTSPLLVATLCATLTACGGGDGTDTPVANSAGTMGATSLSTVTSKPSSTSSTSWTVCADQGAVCSYSGAKEVRYGTATNYVAKTLTGPVACTDSVFGDPAPGLAKTCTVAASTTASPAGVKSPSSGPSKTAATATVTTAPAGAAITTVQLSNATGTTQTNAAATFGQTFAEGHLPNGETVFGRSASGASVPLQVDVKARHADGSVRHAIITAQLPSSAAGQVDTISLVKGAAQAASAPATPATLLNSGFTAAFTATLGGVQYTASADELLKSGKYTTWLSGSLVNEWIVQAPLKNASGVEHPHLMAQFAIRSYAGSNSARVDVTVENGWAFQASPQNFTYDAQVLVGGQPVFTQAALPHYHHARWRKVFWWGKAQSLKVRHDTRYLIASKALPNLNQALTIKETTIALWASKWNNSKKGPMDPGVAMAYMPTTGGRADIGLLPGWSALYLLSMDQRLKDVSLGQADLAGSWSSHYRDKITGRPITLASYPYLSRTYAGAAINPATKKGEYFPDCPQTVCATPLRADTAHQPAFSYLPYLVTGDYYHLEELQFWANYNSWAIQPAYREYGKGVVRGDQVRGQAWSLRSIAQAAYISPDNDPQKANFMAIANHNIDWYNNTYTYNATANKLGVITNGYSFEYLDGTAIAPWQDDFFTMIVGHMVELGFKTAQPLLAWKSKFAIDRVVGTGFCAVQAPAYNLKLRDSRSSATYTTIGQVYQASASATLLPLACGSSAMATSLRLRTGEWVGNSASPQGQQGLMQGAMAYAAGTGSNGAAAWTKFITRTYQPDYSAEPQFAVMPR